MEMPNVISNAFIINVVGSPFEGHEFDSKVLKTSVSGQFIYDEGTFFNKMAGQRLKFEA